MFQLADDSIEECIRLWTELGDCRKLADAVGWCAFVCVFVYLCVYKRERWDDTFIYIYT